MNERENPKKQTGKTDTVVIKKLKGKASGFTQGSVGVAIEFINSYWTYYD